MIWLIEVRLKQNTAITVLPMQVVYRRMKCCWLYNLQTSYTVPDCVRLGEGSRRITLHDNSHTFFDFRIHLGTTAYIINYNNAPTF
jgi:hypothetical protein